MLSAEYVKMLVAVMDGGLSPSFNKLILGERTNWKRISKFNYGDGVRRYFYLVKSCLIATVDERKATIEEVTERKLKDFEGIAPEKIKKFLEAKMVKIMIRPPMEWEHIILQDARPEDKWIHEDLGELLEKYYDFCTIEAAKGSEPQQYTFECGPENDGWIFFSPIKCDHFDQHLTDDLDPILPAWLIKSGEIMKCTYGIDEHPLWRMGQLDDALESIKKELIELGFVLSMEDNYAKCL